MYERFYQLITFKHSKNTLLIQIGVKIVWDNVDCRNGQMDGSWDEYLASPAEFLTNLAKEREPGIKIIIFDYY